MDPQSRETDSRSALRADAVLLAVTVVWGSCFVVMRRALDTAPPFLLLSCRFGLGAALIAPWIARRPRPAGMSRDALVLGSLLAVGMSLQVSGQAGTTATNAGFLTGLASVVTPFVAVARTRKLPTLANALGIALASAGFLLLTFPTSGASFQRGDLLVGASAVLFAFYGVELAERGGRHDAFWLTALQLATVALWAGLVSLVLRTPVLSGSAAGLLETRPIDGSPLFLRSVLYLGVFCTGFAFLGWTWAQGRMSAIHGAIILALEPVVAALLAAWILGERLGRRGVAGALFVMAGIVVSEVRPKKARTKDSEGLLGSRRTVPA